MADESAKTEHASEAAQAPATSDATGSGTPAPQTQPAAPADTQTPQKDIVMSDAPIDQAASPAPAAVAPSPAAARTGTPAQGSRAPSVHPEAGVTMPSEAAPHGDPTRRYFNSKVTGVLLEGMKQLAKDQPPDPLRVLGEYLIQRSKELEGTS
ncbi:COMPASS (complex proteins associated with Set1p) component [Purpureocillium takamizusanense]|uniref:COMPASS (Complex proteins associated with Set1p) component n=1 Tax=Purpureocillium takamizusanense TaxID=2060973 RepID=A0A9Q8Q8Y4_9HYPO|nr:COMPASS (complex proteins associated with Set1p) component [Purpureocillium takamizusanense]UNI14626.1 COMPASS (complex proteins associated with Set1p) component [Purpureocillium takamizusanense]